MTSVPPQGTAATVAVSDCKRTQKVLELCLALGKGGREVYVLRAIGWLAQSKMLAFAVVAPRSQLEPQLREQGLPYRSLKVRFPWFPLIAARRLARWITNESVHVVHLHWSSRELCLAVLARWFVKRPVRLVYTRHLEISRSKHDWYHRTLYRQLDLVLSITGKMREDARRHLPLLPERVQVLYHGVEAPAAVPSQCKELRAKFGVDAGFLIGLFGRIEPGKGQQLLVNAMALLRERGCEVHAVLFGHPMQQQHLDDLLGQISRLKLEERVRYAGFHPKPQEIMGCFDCIVLTTYAETFGLVLIEAMRAGTVVIGTSAGGVPEIIDDGKTGLLVPPGDAAALADAIERLISDGGLRDRLAAAGKASADERFNERRHFESLVCWLRGEAPP